MKKNKSLHHSADKTIKRTRPLQKDSEKEAVFVTVTGMSPAVITETVWALAHEKPPIRPKRIIAFGTTRSRDSVVKELLESGVWEKLREALRAREDELIFTAAGEHIRVFTHKGRELSDLRTAEENEAVADFMLENLRAFTDNPDLQIVASIAGGRKTMGALLYGCMTLIGREDDRITHVLVSEKLERRQNPKFYFPQNAAEGKGIDLAEVPFVPLRNLFPREWGRLPGAFTATVLKYKERIGELLPEIKLKVFLKQPRIEVNGREIPLSAREQILMLVLAERAKAKQPPLYKFQSALDRLAEMKERLKQTAIPGDWLDWRGAVNEAKFESEDDIRRVLTTIRSKLQKTLGELGSALMQLLPRRGHFALDLPPENIEIVED